MIPIALSLVGILLAAVLGLQIALLRRRIEIDLSPVDRALERMERALREEAGRGREEASSSARAAREELAAALQTQADTLAGRIVDISIAQAAQLDSFNVRLESLRGTVDVRLEMIRQDNALQLEKMRVTVDEKLQGTLQARLGESFKLFNDRLEQVYRSLGEMQSLAAGVGDLKRILSNVKTRGSWGEIQLGSLLEQMLAPQQYARNVQVKEGAERVEFAVRLPGTREDCDEPVWLPIDAKFPKEDFERLGDALERSDMEAADAASKQLEQRVRQCATDIAAKYINPPRTTDFAIMFLPTEGLFGEVVRRTPLVEGLLRDQRVVIAGPTTLAALLNSLQMGFRTLAIQKRSSEVWSVLGQVKKEFENYSTVLSKIREKLSQATSTVDSAEVRTRAIQRSLRDVQAEGAQTVLFEEPRPEGNSEDSGLRIPPPP